MKHSRWISLVTMFCIATANAALRDGDAAPDFNVRASLAGQAFNFALQDALKKGPVVVYFYPSAFTRGCNLQAHTFAVNQQKFAAVGATVVGVSLDPIETLNEFSADPDYCAGKIPVASDPEGKVARAYGLNVRAPTADKKDTRGVQITHGAAERTTFIVTADNKIASVIGGVSPAENVARALAAVQQLAQGRPST